MTGQQSIQIFCRGCGCEVSPSIEFCQDCGLHQPKGTGGWLLFFILTLIVFGPIGRMADFKAHYHHSMELFSNSGHPYLLYGFYAVEQVLGFAISGYGVFAGIQLWKKNPAGIEHAKRFMIAMVIFTATDVMMAMNWVALMGRRGSFSKFISWGTLKPLFNAIAYTLIWYSYLVKSTRVHMTFQPEAVPEGNPSNEHRGS